MHRSHHAFTHSGFGSSAFTSPNPDRHYAPDLGLEPTHRDISLRVDLDAQSAEGEVTTTVTCRRGGAESIKLDAADFFDVEVTSPDGQRIDWHYDGEAIYVSFLEPIAVGDTRRIRTRYSVHKPLTGMLFSGPDEANPDRPSFMATDHETERARFWLPCVDHPSVRTPLDIHLRAKSELTILANGLEMSRETHDDGSATVHWRLEQPCPSYLVCLAVGDFIRVDGGEHQGLEIAFFTTPNFRSEDLARSFEKTKSMLDWMTKRLSTPFPFPKYFQLAVPGIGGAMENISLVTWDDKFVANEALYAEWGWLIDIINVHEMGHSYFGDAVVSRDYAHVWLKESWATYIESCWLEDCDGLDAMAWQLSEDLRVYRQEADNRYVRPIVTREFDSSWDMYDAHLYPGGAVRLHMLRCLLGDEDFWGGVADYLAAYSGEVVETSDFRRCMEDRSGRSLARFFDEWFRSPGYLKLRARTSYDSKVGELVVKVEQKQINAKKGIGLFHAELEIDVAVGDGEWLTHRLCLDEVKSALVIKLEKRPLSVVFDPRGKLVHALDYEPSPKESQHALLEAPTVPGRIQAARILGKSAERAGVAALLGAYACEEHWGVRIEIARALAAAGTQGACEGLAGLVEAEEDVRVVPELLGLLGGLRDESVGAAICDWLDSDAGGPLARWKALTSLGKQRGPTHLERLRSEASAEGHWGWGRRGAMTGLGATRTEEARKFLAERTVYGSDLLQVRIAAVEALAEAARWQGRGAREETVEILTDLIRDPEYGMRAAVARALRSLGMGKGIAAMESAAKSLAPQDRPRIHRSISGLRRQLQAGGKVGQLTKQVEELRKQLRELTERVDLAEAKSDQA